MFVIKCHQSDSDEQAQTVRAVTDPLRHILSQLSTPAPLSPPTVAWPQARAWEEPATHSGQPRQECKHKALTDMAGMAPEFLAKTTIINSRCPELKKKKKKLKPKDIHVMLARSKQFVKEKTAGEKKKVGEESWSQSSHGRGAGSGIDVMSAFLRDTHETVLTWRVPHIQLDPVLVYLETGCVVLKHCGHVVLKNTGFHWCYWQKKKLVFTQQQASED